MKQLARKKYPLGIQTFSQLREEDYLYIDKTAYVYQMTHDDSKYMFLSRPRRFGKSLLTSTLRTYFEGKKEYFQGLAIEQLETEWESYPVLHFDMSLGKHKNAQNLTRYLHNVLQDNELRLGISNSGETENVNIRLKNLIRDAYEKYGKRVVVLVDEYDAPLLDVVHEEETLPILRDVMRNFYSPLKACDSYLRYVFLTGITKFSQLSIFSELNNIQNISMMEAYAAICGISAEEIKIYMEKDLKLLADKLKVTEEEAFEALKQHYDGYHFTWPSPDMYNPFSLLNAFSTGKMDSFWFESGTPTYLIEMLQKYEMNVIQLGADWETRKEDFDMPTERLASILPLLYQSGYYTIKQGDIQFESYTLGIPNQEVRIGLMQSLVPYYITPHTQRVSSVLIRMARALYKEDMEDFLQALQTFLSTVPYTDNTDYEGHYQQMLYIIFSLLGMYMDVEVRTPRGRVDLVMRTATKLYLIELKLDKSADEALMQIDLKRYPERFALGGLPMIKVGINFDSERHTLKDWKIEEDK